MTIPVPRPFLESLLEIHQDAADALVDSHGDAHREICARLEAMLSAAPEPVQGGAASDASVGADEDEESGL